MNYIYETITLQYTLPDKKPLLKVDNQDLNVFCEEQGLEFVSLASTFFSTNNTKYYVGVFKVVNLSRYLNKIIIAGGSSELNE